MLLINPHALNAGDYLDTRLPDKAFFHYSKFFLYPPKFGSIAFQCYLAELPTDSGNFSIPEMIAVKSS